MAKPKLALIPASQGSKVFSVLPSDGSGDFDFSRSGKATRINSQGLIEEVSNGQSRLNYPMIDGKVVGCPSLLLEPQRGNVITYSEDFTNAAWEYGGATKTGNAEISPDGTLNADKIEITTLSSPNLRQTVGVLPNTQYTFSFYVKSSDLSKLKLSIYDLSNASYIAQDVEKIINSQWLRVSVTFTTPIGCNLIRAFIFQTSEELGSFYVWGAMLEIGSYQTSYIPNLTTGSTTRSAETCNGAGDSDTFNDSEGVLMAEISALNDSQSSAAITISDSSLSNRVFIGFESGEIRVLCINALSTTIIDTSGVILENYNKVTCAYADNTFKLLVNGFQVGDTESFIGSLSGINELAFDRGDGANNFYGNVKQLQYFQTALTDSELEELTSWDSFIDMATSQLYTIQ